MDENMSQALVNIRQKLPPLSRENSQDNIEKYRYSPVENPFKSGPTFTVGGVKHHLPKPHTLKPYVDTKAGVLDTWPAHATGNTSTKQVGLSKNKQLVIVDNEKLGKPQTTPKPRFLHNLEEFLKKELKSLGVTVVEPNELRLQAHREVFEYLIDDFPTYKPLLAAIKSEYEQIMSSNRNEIRKLEPLKQVLISTTEECETKLETLRNTDKPEIHKMKENNRRLEEIIESTKLDQNDVKEQVQKLQHKLSEQYEEYRDEADARKLLVLDINELRYRHEDLLMQQQASSNPDGEDPLLMKIALRRAKIDEKRAVEDLKKMQGENMHVVPRRDVEALQKNLAELKKKLETRVRDLEMLKAEHETLIDVHKQVIKQKEDFSEETERLRQTATPRPDWEKCADYVPGGIQRWLELSEGHSSDELVDIVLQEIGNKSGDQNTPEYFEGQGDDPDVPAYLRFEGQVRNRHVGKHDTAILIKDIWKVKALQDAEKLSTDREPMSEFLVKYLRNRYPLNQMVVEWCYNIHDSCQRFAHDDKIAMFLGILTDEIDEEVYFDQLKTISGLLQYLQRINEGSDTPGRVTKDMFRLAINDFFEDMKPEGDVDTLLTAVEQELGIGENDDLIEFTNLFLEDDEGKFGSFIDELKRQMEKDKLQYVSDIMKELDNRKIFSDELEKAVMQVDQEIESERVTTLLFWAYRCQDKETLEAADPIAKDELEQRLINGAIKRVTPIM